MDTEAQTFEEFFKGMSEWTFVENIGGIYNCYIFRGMATNNKGVKEARLTHSRYMINTTISKLSDVCTLRIVTQPGSNKPLIADTYLRTAIRQMNHFESQEKKTREDLVRTRNNYTNLNIEHQKVINDFQLLNDHLNQYATDRNMCSDYEQQLKDWSDTLSTMKLNGRKRNYSVPVMIPALSDDPMYVFPVEAHSAEAATAIVRSWPLCNVIENLAHRGHKFSKIADTVEIKPGFF